MANSSSFAGDTLVFFAGVTAGIIAISISVQNDFNKAAEEIRSQRMQVTVDTTYTRDGQIADIKHDTTYVITHNDFEKLKRYPETVDKIKKQQMQVSADTTYTKDGEIADIKRDTTYVVTKADFDKLHP